MPAIGQDTFHCYGCDANHPNAVKFINRFKDEQYLVVACRARRSDTHEEGDQIRCKHCHSARNRIQRLVESEEWGEDFKSV